MRLRKTEGTVSVSDSGGKEVSPRNDLGLYSGYEVGTQSESYAWIDLDSVKLTKLDQDSEIAITKEDKKLGIEVKAGSLFFNVTEPLAEDETMNIRTSTMVVGIRGTCGWVTEDTAALLEGTVEVTAGEQSVTINAGEMAVLTADGTLEVKPFTSASVPAFVKAELEEDEDLAAAIQDTTGMDLTGNLEGTYPDVFDRIANEGGKILFAEEIDFEVDGNPELLVICTGKGGSDRQTDGVQTIIYRKGTERSESLCGYFTSFEDGYRISLVESEGRPYVLCYWHYVEGDENYVRYDYMGAPAQNDGDNSSWDFADRVAYLYGTSPDRRYSSYRYGSFADTTAEEFEAVIQKYTEVRELVTNDGTNVTIVEP